MKKECVEPALLFDSKQYGFSQVVATSPGKMVFISGQVAWDKNQVIVGENDLKKQTEKSIDNLKLAMEAVGGSLNKIVMLRIYKVDYQPEDGEVISEVLKSKFGTATPPASTWINVKGLANKDFLIEIEAQAVI